MRIPEEHMYEHVFADETKAKGFVLAAAVIMPDDLASLRSFIGALRLPHQRRLHFKSESNGRRKMIMRSLVEARMHVRVYDGTRIHDGKKARDEAIAQLVDDLVAIGATRLVLEIDDSVVQNDRLVIRRRLLKARAPDLLRYEHCRASEECLLAVPDAVAWCWARGQEWRKRAEPLIQHVVVI